MQEYERFSDEEFADEVLTALERKDDDERRRELERVGRIAAEVEVDLEDPRTTTHLYYKTRRRDAIATKVAEDYIDLRDPFALVAIAEARAEVKEYRRFRLWLKQQLHAGATAAQIIDQEYGQDNDQNRYND